MSLGASGMASSSIPKRVYCVHFNRSYKAAIARDNAAARSIVIGGEEACSVPAGRPAVLVLVLLYLNIRIRDALINFDVLMTEGFGLEVDGRMKAVFPTQEEAQKSAEILKARYPLLQVKVYDALSSGITCTKPAGSRPAGFALAYCCSLPWACIRRTAKASRSEIESFDRSRGRRNHLHKYIRFCHRQRTALSATDKRRAICWGIELCTRGMSG
jgi:hypothetical protein